MKYVVSLFLLLATLLGYSVVTAQQVAKDVLFEWPASVCEGTCVGGVDGYRVYTEQGVLVKDVQGLSYLAEGTPMTVGVEYSYYVTAYNEDGESGPSNVASVKVDGTAPSSTTLRVKIQ